MLLLFLVYAYLKAERLRIQNECRQQKTRAVYFWTTSLITILCTDNKMLPTTNLSGTKSLCSLFFHNHDVFVVDEDALLSFILLSAAIAAATEGGRSLRSFCLSPMFSSFSSASAAGEANSDSRSRSVKNC